MGIKEEVQGRYRRRVEVDRGDLSGGRVRGELAPFVFVFPSHLPFLGFPLTTSLQGQKCTNQKKRPKVEDMTSF